MTPPTLALALIAAVAPSHDYEFVVGDLHEEYVRIARSRGTTAADRWFWSQTLLSLRPLLSYSRTKRSPLQALRVALIAFGVLLAMLVVLALIETAFQTVIALHDLPEYGWLCIYNADALVFGALLAWLVRTDGVRVTFYASAFLVLCFVVPAVAGHPGSQAPWFAWVQLVAVVPDMCLGAAIYQSISRKARSST